MEGAVCAHTHRGRGDWHESVSECVRAQTRAGQNQGAIERMDKARSRSRMDDEGESEDGRMKDNRCDNGGSRSSDNSSGSSSTGSSSSTAAIATAAIVVAGVVAPPPPAAAATPAALPTPLLI